MQELPTPGPAAAAPGRSGDAVSTPSFECTLDHHGLPPLRRLASVTTLQVNVGKFCNQACHHCHVDAGPRRTEKMTRATAERVLALLDAGPAVETVDITGGAPELNESFRFLVEGARRRGRAVLDRCNLTVFYQPGQEDTPEFLAEHQVGVVASLPCYTKENVEKQRGANVFDRSIEALQRLNRLGYGLPGSDLRLDLVYNPVGPYLPGPQAKLEADYREQLGRNFGVQFHRLITIANMPISRFAEDLARTGRQEEYLSLLVNHFNPETVAGLMCRSLLSVGYDGALYDCDFNQMLEIPLGGRRVTIWDMERLDALAGAAIATGSHCYGCTAGAGSGCSGAIV